MAPAPLPEAGTMPQPNLQDAQAVVDLFQEAAAANLNARCRQGSIDVIDPPGRLIASGDLHDNPIHFAKLAQAANLGEGAPGDAQRAHLTLHEIIHSDRLMNGMDFSFRALGRAAVLKLDHPEHVHTLLANHELAQVIGSGLVKDGVSVVEAFEEGVEYAFGDQTEQVIQAISIFIRSMPLALRCKGPEGDVLCSHSLPGPFVMDRFDPDVLERELTDDDYVPRQGSAHLMIWGRNHKPEQLEALAQQWGVKLFVLGHEKAENGALFVPPNALVLNSDHERGVYLPLDLADPPSAEEAAGMVVPLSQ